MSEQSLIQKIPLEFSYKRETGLWVRHLDGLPFPANFHCVEKSLVYIPPQRAGGNHKHPRIEGFIGIGEDLNFFYLDEKGKVHEEQMNPKGELVFFFVSPFVPHAVINTSSTQFGILYEVANEKQHDVEMVDVIGKRNVTK